MNWGAYRVWLTINVAKQVKTATQVAIAAMMQRVPDRYTATQDNRTVNSINGDVSCLLDWTRANIEEIGYVSICKEK